MVFNSSQVRLNGALNTDPNIEARRNPPDCKTAGRVGRAALIAGHNITDDVAANPGRAMWAELWTG